jgi:hypothetical protein
MFPNCPYTLVYTSLLSTNLSLPTAIYYNSIKRSYSVYSNLNSFSGIYIIVVQTSIKNFPAFPTDSDFNITLIVTPRYDNPPYFETNF